MKCSKCNKTVSEDNVFSLAKTHGKYFIVPGIMKGSFGSDKLIYCGDCAKRVQLEKKF